MIKGRNYRVMEDIMKVVVWWVSTFVVFIELCSAKKGMNDVKLKVMFCLSRSTNTMLIHFYFIFVEYIYIKCLIKVLGTSECEC